MPANLPLFPTLPRYAAGAGIRTAYAQMLPTGTRITYVRSTGVQTGDTQDIAERILPTLDAGLKECRSGIGDIVVILPGHTETVTSTSLANLVAGTRIIGYGDLNRDDAPTFTWSSAAATWAISVKNVYIEGLRLLMDNFNGVTAPINITASGCTLTNNYMRWSSSAALLATTAITVGSGATDCSIMYNEIQGAPLGICTDGIKLLGATTPDRCKIVGNVIMAACTAAGGVINVTVAAKNVFIASNRLENTTALSVACIQFAANASDGICCDNFCTFKNTGAITSGTFGIIIGAGCVVGFHQNFCVNDPAASGVLKPTVDT